MPHNEVVPRRRLELFSGRSHPELAEAIALELGFETLGEAQLSCRRYAKRMLLIVFGDTNDIPA